HGTLGGCRRGHVDVEPRQPPRGHFSGTLATYPALMIVAVTGGRRAAGTPDHPVLQRPDNVRLVAVELNLRRVHLVHRQGREDRGLNLLHSRLAAFDEGNLS